MSIYRDSRQVVSIYRDSREVVGIWGQEAGSEHI